MAFVILGVVLIGLNLAGIGPTANWNWYLTGDLWKFCLPFVLAAAWWAWADKSGRNKRIEIERMEARKEERRKRNLDTMGMGERDKRR